MHSSSTTIDWQAALEEHRPWLAKVLRCRIGDRHEVDDLLQEIALAVFRQNLKTNPPDNDATNEQNDGGEETNQANTESEKPTGGVPSDPEKVAPWLYRLAVRQAVNFHRRANRKTKITPVADLETTAQDHQPLDWMMAEEQSKHLNDAVSQLSPQQQEILTLKYTENWSYQQISNHLGIPVRSVEYRLLQARKQLRKLVVNGVISATRMPSV